ncbi:TPA: hypothetical protein QCY19_004002 [Bacillus luti]|nr:hypothetical protein [Bacillus luti]
MVTTKELNDMGQMIIEGFVAGIEKSKRVADKGLSERRDACNDKPQETKDKESY